MSFNHSILIHFFMSIQSSEKEHKVQFDKTYINFKGAGRLFQDRAINTDLSYASMHLTERNVMQIRIKNIHELNDCLVFGEELGRGTFARVIAVKDRCSDNEWALKIIEKPSVTENMKYIRQEIDILKLVQHPHIIYLYKVYESATEILLLMEKCGPSLLIEYRKRKPFSEKEVKKLIKEMASAVAYLHKNDIVHRDIKLENILLGKNPKDPKDTFYSKLTDFGLSVIKSGVGISSLMNEFCGTLAYMAPEMITKPTYSQQCDIWSLGVIMYTLLSSKMPFSGENEKALIEDIVKKDPKYSGLNVSHPCMDVLQKMLMKDPAQRITAAEILMHGWISNDPRQNKGSENVLDMMKRWKSDLKVPEEGRQSDWVSPQRANQVSIQKEPRIVVPVTIKNIEFQKNKDRNGLGNNKQKVTHNKNQPVIKVHHKQKPGPSKIDSLDSL